MDNPKESLLDESRNRFMELASYLDSELKKLYDDGVLTKTDWIKLVEDSKLSGQAVLNAINRTDYPPEMQKELVKNLISQYEISIEQTLQDARFRRYAPERIEERLASFEKPVLTNWENALNAKTISQRQYQDMISRVKTYHKDAVNGIRSIPAKHPKRTEMIESWLNEYKQQMEKLAITPAPQLSYAPSKAVSSDYSKRANQVEPQPVHPEPKVGMPKTAYTAYSPKVEKPKTVDANPSPKDDEGLFEKILSWFKK